MTALYPGHDGQIWNLFLSLLRIYLPWNGIRGTPEAAKVNNIMGTKMDHRLHSKYRHQFEQVQI